MYMYMGMRYAPSVWSNTLTVSHCIPWLCSSNSTSHIPTHPSSCVHPHVGNSFPSPSLLCQSLFHFFLHFFLHSPFSLLHYACVHPLYPPSYLLPPVSSPLCTKFAFLFLVPHWLFPFLTLSISIITPSSTYISPITNSNFLYQLG